MAVFGQIGGNLVLCVVLPVLGDGNGSRFPAVRALCAVRGDDSGRAVLAADNADVTGTAGQRAENQQERQP